MPYDVKRGLYIGAASAGVAYFAAPLIGTVVDAVPYTATDSVKPVAMTVVAAMAGDAIAQMFL